MHAYAATSVEGESRVWLAGVCLDVLTEREVIDQVIASLLVGRGGWIATPNVYFLRSVHENENLYGLLAGATLRIPDGMPLVWASRLGRSNQMTRVAGSSLMLSLSEAAAHHGRSVYILGGREGAAEAARNHLVEQNPTLRVVGAEGPWLTPDVSDEEVEPILARLEAAAPDIVMCGVGFPKQERFIAKCRQRLPNTWFLGCGAAINFAAGYEQRAPGWMQRNGLEWLHRLISEPRRLFPRYAADMPFALKLLLASAWHGLLRRPVTDAAPATPGEIIVLQDTPAPVERVITLPEARDAAGPPVTAGP